VLGERPARRGLSMRERQVLQLIADGFGNKAIAAALFVSEETVKTHVRRVLKKLDASSRANAVAIGIRVGLVR
jgi:DNA-binding NarL/FixJ family response regulator